MKDKSRTNISLKIKGINQTTKEYRHELAKGNYIPYKEVASLDGASIGLRPVDLQIMFIVAKLFGIPLGFITDTAYPAIYEKMGLLEDYGILYNDAMRTTFLKC